MDRLSFLWLEITGKCQLRCVHCYADSGPGGTNGPMAKADWLRVLDQTPALGVSMVQFIGGEPTLHPDLPLLIEHALAHRLDVEVFSNLVHVTEQLWELFARPRVSLATSYYSDDETEHAAITCRPSHARTRANIAEAVRRSIPLRAGVIGLDQAQRSGAAHAELVDLGVPQVAFDRLREVGRGVRDAGASAAQLCGHCGAGVAAVSPDGTVWPCVFSRWLRLGNVRDDELAAILDSDEARRVRAELAATFAGRAADGNEATGHLQACHPDCNPSPCQPTCAPRCSPSCSPCQPFRKCWPSYR